MSLKPVTREEHFLARIAGDPGEILEPVTRNEMFLQRIIDNGGQSPGGGEVTSVNGKTGAVVLNADDVGAQTKFALVVTDYGAKGDGVSDDSSAIQSALNAASGGGVIVFPTGVYKLGSAIKFSSNQMLFFEPGATLRQGAEIDNLMRNDAELTDTAYTATQNVVIYGATFDGGTGTTPNTLLAFTHAENILIEQCRFMNGYGNWHDIEINSSQLVTVRNCSFDGSRRSGESGGESIQLDVLTQRAVYPWTDEGAVDSTPTRDVVIDGNTFSNFSLVAVGNHNSATIYGVKITNNSIAGSGTAKAVYIMTVEDLTVSGNRVSGVSTAMDFGSVTGGVISQNAITGSGNAGTQTGVRFSGANNVRICSNRIATFAVAIYVSIAASSVLSHIHDNTIDDCPGVNGRIVVASVDVKIYNNTIDGTFYQVNKIAVSGATPEIMPVADNIYECGELTSLTITSPPASGAYSIVFTSGATATTTTIPSTILGMEDFVAEANTRYEINVLDGYAVVGSWAVSAS